jgi:glycosyltransferase involved in cell wall biosynthesis
MKLNWFSPLPPAKTEIAYYTARIVRELAKRAEVTLWTDQAKWDADLEADACVRRYKAGPDFWAELNRGDMSIYHIGNNALFHNWIWQVSREHPGVVILHDLHLHHFFAGVYCGEARGMNEYLAQMEFYYGEEGRRDSEDCFRRGAPDIHYLAERYPLTLLALENALGVLVHTRGAFEILKQENRWPVVYAPLPYMAAAAAHVHAPGCRKDGLHQLILFGHLGDNRRLDVLFQALAELPAKDKFHLDIYGQLWDKNLVLAQVRSLNLKNHVTLHGFVAEDELKAALTRASLAINLRYPTMGEASASQLRIWSHSLPSLVTEVGWYATLPADSVAFVRPETEVADIKAHLNALLEDPERFIRMGARGRQVLEEEHQPESYVQAILDLALSAQRFRPLAATYMLAERVGEHLRAWTDEASCDKALETVAAEMHALTVEVHSGSGSAKIESEGY